MTAKPLVSVVLPTYNRVRFIAKAIENCLEQRGVEFEVIVVNDGSTDATAEILDELARRNPRVRVIHQANSRLPEALNTGFRAAQGEFLTWTSDDNFFLAGALATMSEYLMAHPAVGMVCANYYNFSDVDATIRVLRELPPVSELGTHNTAGACFMYRRSVADDVGRYNPELELAEDYDYWMRIAARYPIHQLAQPLYLYRTHEESLYSRRYLEVKIISCVARFRNGHLTRREYLHRLWQLSAEHSPERRRGPAWYRVSWKLAFAVASFPMFLGSGRLKRLRRSIFRLMERGIGLDGLVLPAAEHPPGERS